MNKLILILLCLPLLFNSCKKNDDEIIENQLWTKTFGGSENDAGNSVQQTTDGGYIIAGATGPYDFEDVYLLKTDGSGTEQWSQTFGGFRRDIGRSVQQTNDGGYIITGFKEYSDAEPKVYLIKTDASGTEQWTKTFGGSDFTCINEGFSVQQTTDEGYIITGRTSCVGNDPKVYLIKTDSNGNELWSQTLGGLRGYSVQQTTDEGYIITGNSNLGNGDPDVCLIKTDMNGVELWTKTFVGTGYDQGRSVQQTTDGGYIISGGRSNGVFLIKTDASGTEQWSQTFGGTNYDEGYSVQQTTDGGYIITGLTHSFGNGNGDVYLIKTNASGTEQWSQTFGGTGYDIGRSVQQTTDGGYIITGQLNVDWDKKYVYLIKTDGSGNITSTFNIPATN